MRDSNAHIWAQRNKPPTCSTENVFCYGVGNWFSRITPTLGKRCDALGGLQDIDDFKLKGSLEDFPTKPSR